jgi:hypothetical protein
MLFRELIAAKKNTILKPLNLIKIWLIAILIIPRQRNEDSKQDYEYDNSSDKSVAIRG